MNFSPEQFFDLSGFEHAIFFNGVEDVWKLIGEPITHYIAETIRRENRGTVMKGAWVSEDVFIGEGTVVEPGAMIKGPAIIGRHCEIRHTAYIRENVLVGNNCVVGHSTELKGCVLLNHVEAGHFAYVGDSILGNNTLLGAGTKLANFKFDGSEIVLRAGEEKLPTGVNKMGVIAGDGTCFGCNSVTYPGTILGKGCKIMPGVTPRGIYSAESVLKR